MNMNSKNIIQSDMDQFIMGTDISQRANTTNNMMNKNNTYNDNINHFQYKDNGHNIHNIHNIQRISKGNNHDQISISEMLPINRLDSRPFFDESASYSSDKSSSQKIPNINPNISKLISDINKSLDDYAPTNSKNNEDTEDEEELDDQNNTGGWLAKIRNWIKEILLFIIIYFVFSMGFFKKSVGTYIKYINPDENGNVSFIGIIIYGLLLITTFIIARYFIIKYQ